MNWKQLLIKARNQPGFPDRKQRTCHELRNAQITFTENFSGPLEQVRKLGWYFPTNQELESVFLQPDDYHRYTYTQHVTRQLPQLIKQLKENPHTRRAILYLTDEEHAQRQSHLPCLLNIWACIRQKSLHITVHARSIDLLIGLPANLYQVSVLAKEIAKQTQTPLASITFNISSAHVFSDYTEQLERITSLKN
jgi:thymidylate synthase